MTALTLATTSLTLHQAQSWSLIESLQVVGLVMCLLLSAFANGAETALTSVTRLRSRSLFEQGLPGSEDVAYLIKDPNRFLSSILVLNSVAVIVASTLATLLLVHLLGDSVGGLVAPIVTSLVVLVFVEIIPKTVAIHTSEASALRYAPWVRRLTSLLAPVVVLLRRITDAVIRLRGIQVRTGPFVTEEELVSLVTLSEQQGVIEEDEKEMIHGVIGFEETLVREVMVPRVDISAVPVDVSLQRAIEIAVEDGHSRLPLYGESLDHIIGILYVKDMLKAISKGQQECPLRELARPPLEVPETKHLGDLFREFQTKKVHLAIVIDESGGTAGLVTIEDLIEEIVGEIHDEYDKPGEEPGIGQVSDHEWIVDARINLDDLEDELHLGLDSEEYDTLNGFILDQLGALPSVGSQVPIDGRAQLTVLSTTGRRADKVRIVKESPAAEDERLREHEFYASQ
jgi:putative hemolysin